MNNTNPPLLFFKENHLWKKLFFALSIIFSGLTLWVSVLHYQNRLAVNSTLWIFWLLSIITLLICFLPPCSNITKYWRYSINKNKYLIILAVSILYFLIRVWGYENSPLNGYSLFDDAAWDIYNAKKWILSDKAVFQPSFLEPYYGSRESFFHYYIIALFELFGYNLLVFNMGLFFLGYLTVLFTTLIIHQFFNRLWITSLGAIILLTFPLHVTQTFMGHRYAIALPLIMISYYYLASGFKKQSSFQVCIGALFMGFALCGTPMGKQFLLAMLLTILLSVIFCANRQQLIRRNYLLLTISLITLVITLIPLFCYILFNFHAFLNREQGLISTGFLEDFQTLGFSIITTRLHELGKAFFAPQNDYRLYMELYPLIPYAYWLLLMPGMVIAFTKKRWEILIMCLLPAFIAFLTTPFDYRIQISTPFWIITILYTVYTTTHSINQSGSKISSVIITGIFLCILTGLISSTRYINIVYSSPEYIPLIKINDVAFLRLVQDIARGNKDNPSTAMSKDELKPNTKANEPDYDTFICSDVVFAGTHLYFQNLHETQSLSFCGGGSSAMLVTPDKILAENQKSLTRYANNHKNLVLLWEKSDTTKPVVDLFKPLQKYGRFKTYRYFIDLEYAEHTLHEVWSLQIDKENVPAFLHEVQHLKL